TCKRSSTNTLLSSQTTTAPASRPVLPEQGRRAEQQDENIHACDQERKSQGREKRETAEIKRFHRRVENNLPMSSASFDTLRVAIAGKIQVTKHTTASNAKSSIARINDNESDRQPPASTAILAYIQHGTRTRTSTGSSP
ncbi:hypothetical protein, partial [uncultured Bifidobacterium sp.]|uniref:hypothetical protein n=1 Tax=uncultured Bifidobacterium sp. TaxID=165187 RepID=UPI0026388002